ncbi:hypothetical protein [Cryptosporangium phraense]|uniref:Ferritin-like domain-containing protein n=1 Tax=Cryptosporangium phraense TaxID=2593070 RepID=A0A545ATX3_9ACTN|nr:hypothetical protein [Cryptosporangium phraense]TQS44797.1 hypothetical protein FL583_12630 [Cryptosporangium phraense]
MLGLLAAGAAGSVSACGIVDPGPAVPAVAADPLETLVTQKQALLDLYQATLTTHTDLADRLGPLRDAHREHRDALLELLDARRRGALARAASPVPGPEKPAKPPAVSQDPDGALVALRAAEKTATARSRTACLAATTGTGDSAGAPERVTVLGCISAAEASHAVALAVALA